MANNIKLNLTPAYVTAFIIYSGLCLGLLDITSAGMASCGITHCLQMYLFYFSTAVKQTDMFCTSVILLQHSLVVSVNLQPMKYLMKTVVEMGMTVLQVKQKILTDMCEKQPFCGLAIDRFV